MKSPVYGCTAGNIKMKGRKIIKKDLLSEFIEQGWIKGEKDMMQRGPLTAWLMSNAIMPELNKRGLTIKDAPPPESLGWIINGVLEERTDKKIATEIIKFIMWLVYDREFIVT
jgi:Asp-tRNA(Asn)/Glu-tRNA(Gln) amidotransferase B subunit